MTSNRTKSKWSALRRLATTLTVLAAVVFPAVSSAQVPGRFYWKSLSGGNGVPVIFQSISGNANPFDSALTVVPGADIDATMALAGYAHNFTFLDRSATAAIIVPMGRLEGELLFAGEAVKESAKGFGDPTLEIDINVIGPKVQKSLSDAMRYESGFSMDVLVDLALPIGTYDSSQTLNLGLNRWYGRIGAPIVWQLGPWVPGRRTTLEFLPAVWLFGDNTNYSGGKTLETDPMFQLDAHLTRDLTSTLWGSLDAYMYQGGQATIDGISGDKLNNLGFGVTVGYTISDNLGLTFGYKSTVSDTAPTDLRMDNFMITLMYGWHPMVEGAKRLGE